MRWHLLIFGLVLTLSRARLAVAQEFLTEKQALAIVLAAAERIEREEKTLTPGDRQSLEAATGLRFPLDHLRFFVGHKEGKRSGFAVVMDETGKSEAITFMVGVDPKGQVTDVAIMVFRESRGGEVREKRFTRQFKGKTLSDPIRINQDILNYTGATLSSHAVARGVKKALALVNHFYLSHRQ